MIRYLSASSDRFDSGLLGRLGSIRHGYSLATTVTEVRSRVLALKYTPTDSRNITENRPFLAPSRPAKVSLYKPFVAVQCQEYRRGSQGWHGLQLPHDNLLAPPMNDYIKERWAVPDEAWKPFLRGPHMLRVSWVDLASIVLSSFLCEEEEGTHGIYRLARGMSTNGMRRTLGRDEQV